MRRARVELGENAVILNSREASAEASHLGRYEVVFGTEAEADTGPATVATSGTAAWPDTLELIRRELRQFSRQSWARIPGSRSGGAISDSVCEFLERRGLSPLVASGIAETVARSAGRGESCASPDLRTVFLRSSQVSACFDHPPGQTARSFADDLSRLHPGLNSLLPELEAQVLTGLDPRPELLAFVGPPGAGKTSLLIKAAVRFGCRLRRPIRIVCADAIRIGAAEQLRRFSAILGVSFEFHETPAALSASLDGGQQRAEALTLIDTPGFSHRDRGEMQAWAAALNQRGVDCHLVLPATWAREELDLAATRFAAFAPRHLAATHLDQCEGPGRIVSLSIEIGCPISLLSFGPSIPEDLEAASGARLVDLLVGGASDDSSEQKTYPQPLSGRAATRAAA